MSGFRRACLLCAWLFGITFFVCAVVVARCVAVALSGGGKGDGLVAFAYGWPGMAHSLLCWLICVYMARKAPPPPTTWRRPADMPPPAP